jgi:hypothetical protein
MESFFDQVIVINLDQSIERWRTIQDGFQKMGALSHVTRLAATDRVMADQLLGHVNPRWKLPQVHPDGQVNLAHMARKISHWRALCLAKKKQWKRVLIMEDDVVITESGIERLNQGLVQASSAPLEWDLLWVYGKDSQFPETTPYQSDQSGMVRSVDRCYGTSCYGVDVKCIDQVIEAVENPVYGNLDLAGLFAQHVHPHLKTFIMWPCPVTPNPDLPSTISVAPEPTVEEEVDSPIIKLLMEEIQRRVSDPSSFPVSVMTYWKTRVRPHFLYGSPRATVGNHPLIHQTVTEMVRWMEARLDQAVLVDFLAGLVDVDGLDWIPKCLDVLHVSAFYHGNFGLSVRAASLLEQQLMEDQPRSALALERLREHAAFAREDLALAIKEANVQACGLDGYILTSNHKSVEHWEAIQQRHVEHAWSLKQFRIPPLDPSDAAGWSFVNHWLPNVESRPNELGHLFLWKKLVALDMAEVDAFLVMEGDAYFSDGCRGREWLEAYQQLNQDHPEWDVCFVCHASGSKATVDSIDSGGYHVDPVDPGSGAVDSLSAYWINRRGASKMIRFLDGDSGKTEPLHQQLIRHSSAFAVCPSPCRIK